MIQACIFDLDGVIIDTAHFHYLAWQRLAKELGISFNEKDNERLKGVSRMKSLEIILEIGGKKASPGQMEEWATKKNEWFVEYVDTIKPDDIFPGVRRLLDDLKKHQFRLALASSSKNAPRVIRLLGIDKLFDAVVDGTMIKNSKPHPEVFLLAAQKLGLEPSRCVVFEDAEAGVEAALAAGMRCVGVGDPAVLNHANLVVRHTGDFTLENLKELESIN